MKTGTSDFYRHSYYTGKVGPDPVAIHHHEVLLSRLAPLLNKPSESTVLDLGCNLGQFIPALRAHWHHVIGLDLSEQALAAAAAVFSNEVFVQSDLSAGLPFAESCFDLVFGFGILEHLERPEVALREVRRVLKPDGRAVFLQCFRLDSYRHVIDWIKRLPGIRGLKRRLGGGKPALAEMHISQLSPAEWVSCFQRCGLAVEARLATGVIPPIYDFLALLDPLKLLAPLRRYLRYHIYDLPLLAPLDRWCTRRPAISARLARDFIYVLALTGTGADNPELTGSQAHAATQ